jgi:hypothetical protein
VHQFGVAYAFVLTDSADLVRLRRIEPTKPSDETPSILLVLLNLIKSVNWALAPLFIIKKRPVH